MGRRITRMHIAPLRRSRPGIWNSAAAGLLCAAARSLMMPNEVTKPRDSRRPAMPIRTDESPSRDQISPPLMVEGLEAVRDPHC
ncbi:hypothetical protein ACRAVF_22805 [Bradyrhizobium oligotrophicum S58]